LQPNDLLIMVLYLGRRYNERTSDRTTGYRYSAE